LAVFKNKICIRDEDFRIVKTSEKCDSGTESYSTTGVQKMFPTVAASLGQVHRCLGGDPSQYAGNKSFPGTS
jgi:hypothetical protein